MLPVFPGIGQAVPVNLQEVPLAAILTIPDHLIPAADQVIPGTVIVANRHPGQGHHAPILPEVVRVLEPGLIILHAAAKQLLIPVAALLQVHISLVVLRDIIGMAQNV